MSKNSIFLFLNRGISGNLRILTFLLVIDKGGTNRVYISWQHTCWTSAVVDLNSSIYLEPIISLCLRSAFSPSVSSLNKTNASPVALPSGFLTKRTPFSSSRTSQDSSPVLKKSIYIKFRSEEIRVLAWIGLFCNVSIHYFIQSLKINTFYFKANI